MSTVVVSTLFVMPLWCVSPSSAPQPIEERAWRGAIDFGPHDVGFHSETLTRTTEDAQSRTLTMSV